MTRNLAAVVVGLLIGCQQPTNEGYQPTQPIAYSHKVHAGDRQIPCLYCHFAAERGRHAGIPPTAVCMNCHKNARIDKPEIRKLAATYADGKAIPWVRIHRLPDHAYFNHAAHVNAGVACQTCHGEVQTMEKVAQHAPLTMGWCLSCHRNGGTLPGQTNALEPVPQLQPAGAAKPGATPGSKPQLTDCQTCHH